MVAVISHVERFIFVDFSCLWMFRSASAHCSRNAAAWSSRVSGGVLWVLPQNDLLETKNGEECSFDFKITVLLHCSCSQTFKYVTRHRMWKKHFIERNLIESFHHLEHKRERIHWYVVGFGERDTKLFSNHTGRVGSGSYHDCLAWFCASFGINLSFHILRRHSIFSRNGPELLSIKQSWFLPIHWQWGQFHYDGTCSNCMNVTSLHICYMHLSYLERFAFGQSFARSKWNQMLSHLTDSFRRNKNK